MNNILNQIVKYTRTRIDEAKENTSLDEIMEAAFSIEIETKFRFENAIRGNGISFICECKKASPSKGIISHNYNYLNIAKEYELSGASCISVLTEPKWFMGKDQHLIDIAKTVSIPCIRKDFTVDEYMIYQAKVMGASAILLICSTLDKYSIRRYLDICEELGISALVEVHDQYEIEIALESGARVIGVNNRNLKDFTVDIKNSERLRKLVPKDILFVAESGIKTEDDIKRLEEAEVDAVLIGEALMKSQDKNMLLNKLRGII